MRKLFTMFMLLMCFNTYSQYTPNGGYVILRPTPTNINLNLGLSTNGGYGYNSEPRVGPYLILGGASFIVAGLLTSPTYVGGSTTLKKPPVQQPGTWIMITGGILSTVGLVFTISGH